MNVYHEIRGRLLELPPSEPQWLQALLRACDCDFVWAATRGKPCAASSSEGMEGQDEIGTDEVDIIGMKVKAMPRIMMVLWQHIFHEPYSFIFIRPYHLS